MTIPVLHCGLTLWPVSDAFDNRVLPLVLAQSSASVYAMENGARPTDLMPLGVAFLLLHAPLVKRKAIYQMISIVPMRDTVIQ